MKTIIAATVAAFSINAHAFFGVPDEVAHCVDLRNNVAINSMELGERTKCYAEAQGTTSGVRGNFVWVRTGDQYTYVSMQEVREAGTREGVQELITNAVVSNVVVEQLEAEIESLEEQLAEAVADAGVKQGTIDALNVQINTMRTTHGDAVSALEAARDTFEAERDTARAEVNRIQGLLDTATLTIATITNDRDRVQGLLDTANDDLVTANNNLATAQGEVTRLTNELNTANAEVTRLSGELTTANSDLATANAEVTRLTSELATANDDLATANADLAARTAQRDALQATVDDEPMRIAAAEMNAQNAVTVSAPTGLTVTGTGATRTVSVAAGYRLVTDAQWAAQDAAATVNPLAGISTTINGNAVTLSVADGYRLVTDAQWAAQDAAATTSGVSTGLTFTINGNDVEVALASGYRLVNAPDSYTVTVNDVPHIVTADATITVDITTDNAAAIAAARTAAMRTTFGATDYDVDLSVTQANADGVQGSYTRTLEQPSYAVGTTFEAVGNTYVLTATGWEYYPTACPPCQSPVTPGSATARYVDDYIAANPLGNAQLSYTNVDGTAVSYTFSAGLTQVDLDAINDAIDDAYAAGYAAGFNDGYDAGYADGYADGFADGVNSVQ